MEVGRDTRGLFWSPQDLSGICTSKSPPIIQNTAVEYKNVSKGYLPAVLLSLAMLSRNVSIRLVFSWAAAALDALPLQKIKGRRTKK